MFYLVLGLLLPLQVLGVAPAGTVCSAPHTGCSETRCCTDGWQCYQRRPGWAECLQDCSRDEKPGWDCRVLSNLEPACSDRGQDCSGSGCCADPELVCLSRNSTSPRCVEVDSELDKEGSRQTPGGASARRLAPQDMPWQEANGHWCHSTFVPPAPPLHATDLNGHSLPDVCFRGEGPHHVFLIGDWGGILPGREGNEMGTDSVTADHTSFGAHKRFHKPLDTNAQHAVAAAMRSRAVFNKPDYIINVGDAFYWGGVEAHCGLPPFQHAKTEQWRVLFEEMYTGPGLDGKPWLGVLGNHDYGGWMFTAGWDQIIGYTWVKDAPSTGRWIIPAQYWKVRVFYSKFSIDYYFVDTNVFDSMDPNNPNPHNICNMQKSGGPTASCGPQGPNSPWDCPGWFQRLWQQQLNWFEMVLPQSEAEWQFVVTHFPPTWGCDHWVNICRKHGIDLIITGHKHQQEVHYMDPHDWYYPGWTTLKSNFLDPTAWIITGGGGGVTSEDYPDEAGNDDQYGFVDLTLMKDEILVEMVSHGGNIRNTQRIHRWPSAIPTPDPKMRTPDGNEGSNLPGCGNTQHTFYLYRAQSDDEYSPENVNAASLPGVLYYIHHEVVIVCPRKFGITRIRRLKVTVKNTCKLYQAKHTQYGPYVPFDSGKCNVPGCEKIWNMYGPVVGCQHIPFNAGVFAAYCRQPGGDGLFEHCQYAQWFSLPGSCPSEAWNSKTPECKQQIPGGLCKTPDVTGTDDCTYYVEDAGDIKLDELYDVPVGDINAFCASGKMEYNNKTDTGDVHFWDGIYSPLQGQKRIEAVRALFKKKYPQFPESLADAECDFYESDPKDYLKRTGSGFPRYPGSWTGNWVI